MKFNSQYISRFTDSLLKKQEKFEALKELGNNKSIPYQINKCKVKLTEEYKFWLSKSTNMLRANKLADVSRDIDRIKRVEGLKTYRVEDIKLIKEIVEKYGI